MRPPYKPFAYFAKIDEEGNITEYPIEGMVLVNQYPEIDYNALIDSPPEGYVSVFMDDVQPFYNELQYLHNLPPQKEEDGFFYQRWEVRDLSIEQTDEVLQRVREEVNHRINEGRLQANHNFFIYKDKKIACDPLSRSDIDGLNGWISINNKMPDHWFGAWKAKDNTFVSIPDLSAWKEFYNSMFNQGQVNFQHSQLLKAKIAQADTLESIRAITWETETGMPFTPLS